MAMKSKLIVLLCTAITSYNVFCHTLHDAKRLKTDKLLDYEKTFRPIVNQSAPVTVFTALELASIQEFDEVQETLTITAVVVLNWFDETMKWDPKDYGGMKQLVMESDYVWTPNLVLTNNVDKLEKIGDAWQVIRFTADGFAYYYPGDVLSASCKVDVTFYPWDRHRCGFSFNVWGYSSEEVVFFPSLEKVQTTYFSENGAWTFYDSSVELFFDNANVQFSLYLERKPRFIFVNVILPIIFMAFLNTMIFLIPVESGERISYSITVLLALAVFLTLVGDNLPKTSSPMSIFSYYLLTVLIVSICITLATILNVRFYFQDDAKPITGCLASFAKCMKCKRTGISRRVKYKSQKKKLEKEGKYNVHKNIHQRGTSYENSRSSHFISPEYSMPFINGNYKCLPNINRTMHLQEQIWRSENADENSHCDSGSKRNNMEADKSVTTKDVSAAFDILFFTVSILVLTIATTVLFILLLLSERQK